MEFAPRAPRRSSSGRDGPASAAGQSCSPTVGSSTPISSSTSRSPRSKRSFAYPFAYGYSCVGEVERSQADGFEEGSTVFAFHPHQDLVTVRAADAVPLDAVDERVATRCSRWSRPRSGFHSTPARIEEPVVVLGLGPVGVLTAALLQRSGADVVGVDLRADRRTTAISSASGPWTPRRSGETWRSRPRARACPWSSTRQGPPVPSRSRSSCSRTRRGAGLQRPGTGTRRWRSRSAARSIGAGCGSGACWSLDDPLAPGGSMGRAGRRRAAARLMAELPLKLAGDDRDDVRTSRRRLRRAGSRGRRPMHVALRPH